MLTESSSCGTLNTLIDASRPLFWRLSMALLPVSTDRFDTFMARLRPFLGVTVPFLLANSRAAFSEGSPFYIEKKIHLELKGEKDGIR